MFKSILLCFGLLIVAAAHASSDDGKQGKDESAVIPPVQNIRSITPIFSQLLLAPYPSGFVTIFENVSDTQYIRESVPEGENENQWSQMITLNGAKDLATKAGVTSQMLVERIAGGFQRACPTSFLAIRVSDDKIGGNEAFAAIVSCGTSPTTDGKQSETALIAVIKGDKDFYTVQWAERATASKRPLTLDASKWVERYKTLTQVKLCHIVPGEQAPYPSCVD
ncbi:hypothetical protein [Solimicrobium silvestre]|uniref:Uncharacterized protein n=1 Tax=Solimicrobium silvestre TaxID=2099400 RepID=A0A2S9H436_9BURK|nr:hypothetical protein [Solimicrobium silvestre]PRC94738.1 hypothetical protein S2091_0741 [Solimicrobium silvestre]